MVDMLIYFLPAILFLGVITSFDDITYHKIKNKWLLATIIYSIIVYGILLGFNSNILFTLYPLFISLFISICIGFSLWYFDIWSAGDGKLFIVFSLLLFLCIPSITNLGNLSFSFLLIIFLIGFAFLFFSLFKKLKQLRKIARQYVFSSIFDLTLIFTTIISLFSLSWLISLILHLINIPTNYYLFFLLSFLIFFIIKYLLKPIFMLSCLGVSCLRLFLDKSIYSLSFVAQFLLFALFSIILLAFTGESAMRIFLALFSKRVKTSNLKVGMLLRKDTKRPLTLPSSNKYNKVPKSLLGSSTLTVYPAEGITMADILRLKKHGIKGVRVLDVFPFAPIIFIAALIVLIIHLAPFYI